MMWSVEDIIKECERLSSLVGDTFDLQVAINGRLTRTLGRVCTLVNTKTGYVTLQRMEFSRQLLETASDESIKGIIGHEWCHYIIAKTTHERHGHDALFKSWCARVGVENDKAATAVERVVAVQSKYEVYCGTCKKTIANYSRMSNTLRNINQCTCKACNTSNLSLIQNW